jgi:hypothetical protein
MSISAVSDSLLLFRLNLQGMDDQYDYSVKSEERDGNSHSRNFDSVSVPFAQISFKVSDLKNSLQIQTLRDQLAKLRDSSDSNVAALTTEPNQSRRNHNLLISRLGELQTRNPELEAKLEGIVM